MDGSLIFGALLLYKMRKEAGMSQARAADAMGCDHTMYQEFESGARDVYQFHINALKWGIQEAMK